MVWSEGKELNNGKFIIVGEEPLGSGGFGITYKVARTRDRKLFVIKTLNAIAQSKSNFRQLKDDFLNEAHTLASFKHPNIVKIYPKGFTEPEDELWCMVMEFIEGQNLEEYLEENKEISEIDAIALITKIGAALTYIHQSSYLHRDIKPSNIMLRNCDLSSPVLIDFGLAREFDPNQSLTMDSRLTEHYAPLEQYDLDSLLAHINIDRSKYKVGTWTDVYSLAATLYNLLTKTKPMIATFRQLSPKDFKSPKQLNPKISDRTNEIILKGMSLNPQARSQTIPEYLNFLKSALEQIKLTNVNEVDRPYLSEIKQLEENWFDLGLRQVSAREFEKAIKSFEKALKINPNNSQAWHNRGSAFGRLGKYREAIKSFEKVLKINPNNPQTWSELAHVCYQSKLLQRAIDSWSSALKLDPENYLFWYNHGCVLEQIKIFSLSKKSYQKALELNPNFEAARSKISSLESKKIGNKSQENNKKKQDNCIRRELLQQRIVLLEDMTTSDSINFIIAQLLFLEIEDSQKDIYLYINSSGGSVSGGFAIYDTIQIIKPNVMSVCTDMAAGMAGLLLASGKKGKRICLSDSKVGLIPVKLGGTKRSPLVLTELNYCNRKVNETLSKHTGQTIEKIQKDTSKEFYLTPKEAKEYGFVDVIMDRNNSIVSKILEIIRAEPR